LATAPKPKVAYVATYAAVPAERRAAGQGDGCRQREGYDRVVAGYCDRVEEDRPGRKDHGREDGPGAAEGAGGTGRKQERRHENERHFGGEEIRVAPPARGEEGWRHEDRQAPWWVLDREVVVGHLAGEDCLPGPAVDGYVVRSLAKPRRLL
jgi:hypothetical protein